MWALKPSYPHERRRADAISWVKVETWRFAVAVLEATVSVVLFQGCSGTHTCRSIAFTKCIGPEANPILIPEERIFDKLSKRSTRPTSGCSNSSVK